MTINPIAGGTDALNESIGRSHAAPVNGLKNSLDSQKSTAGAALESVQAITFGQNGKIDAEQPGQKLNVKA